MSWLKQSDINSGRHSQYKKCLECGKTISFLKWYIAHKKQACAKCFQAWRKTERAKIHTGPKPE
jgi:RNA polymerase-binding transcription factor DksA